jgi:predicted ATP-grasp superfamily ATP-dependent carboligase
MTSVLLVGNYRPSITVVRSLGQAGYRVIVGREQYFSFAEWSRDSAEAWRHPPLEDPEAFIGALVDFLLARPDVSLLFPIEQAAVALVARYQDRLPASVVPVNVTQSILETCLDKRRMFAVAESVGVPVEPWAVAKNLVELAGAVDEIGLPSIIRPIGSGPERLPSGQKALICADRGVWEREFSTWPGEHDELLVQRYAPGPRHNVHFAARQGRILGRVENVVLRTDRADYTGFAVEGMSVAPDPALDRYLAALIGALDYTGIGVLNFLRLGQGQYHFLELNPRLAASCLVAERCGLELARMACEIAADRISPNSKPVMDYPAGVRFAWTMGDLRGLRQARARGEISFLGAVRWSAQALRSALIADVHLTWSVRDPKPALYLYAYNAPFGMGKLLLPRDRGGG